MKYSIKRLDDEDVDFLNRQYAREREQEEDFKKEVLEGLAAFREAVAVDRENREAPPVATAMPSFQQTRKEETRKKVVVVANSQKALLSGIVKKRGQGEPPSDTAKKVKIDQQNALSLVSAYSDDSD